MSTFFLTDDGGINISLVRRVCIEWDHYDCKVTLIYDDVGSKRVLLHDQAKAFSLWWESLKGGSPWGQRVVKV